MKKIRRVCPADFFMLVCNSLYLLLFVTFRFVTLLLKLPAFSSGNTSVRT